MSPNVSVINDGNNMSEPTAEEVCVCMRGRSASIESCIQTILPESNEGSLEYRLRFRLADGTIASPWHTVPLQTGRKGFLNFVCEIPRGTRAKFEVSTTEAGNPIKQDTKNGKLRFYGIDMLWNYGMLPQTWEDPSHKSIECGGIVGDNDPVDVVEIGSRTAKTGEIYAIKPIAALAMIDEGELDWKVVGISASDPLCSLVNDVTDMELHFPGVLSSIREWFRTYKTHEGKPENRFGLNEQAMDHSYTLGVIAQTHAFWKNLVGGSLIGTADNNSLSVGDVPITSPCLLHTRTPVIPTENLSSAVTVDDVKVDVEVDVKSDVTSPSVIADQTDDAMMVAIRTLVKQYSVEGLKLPLRQLSSGCGIQKASQGCETPNSGPLEV